MIWVVCPRERQSGAPRRFCAKTTPIPIAATRPPPIRALSSSGRTPGVDVARGECESLLAHVHYSFVGLLRVCISSTLLGHAAFCCRSRQITNRPRCEHSSLREERASARFAGGGATFPHKRFAVVSAIFFVVRRALRWCNVCNLHPTKMFSAHIGCSAFFGSFL